MRTCAAISMRARCSSRTSSAAPTRPIGVPVRFVTPNAWHALFVRNMFIRAMPAELAHFRPGFTVLHAPDFQADPARHGTRSATFVVIHFGKKLVLIGGTRYAGEMKKSIFTALNYLLPSLERACRCTAPPTSAPRATPRCSSASRAPARPRSRPIRRASSSATTSTAGAIAASSTSRAAVTPRSSGSGPTPSPRSTRPPRPSARCSRTWSSIRPRAPSTSTTTRSPRTPAPAIRSTTSRIIFPAARADIPKNIILLTADAFGVMPPIARLTRRAGDVSLPVGLHGQGGRHRARRHRARGHLLRLLRRAVPAAASRRLRPDAGRADREAQGAGVAGEHRLDRRALRRRHAHEARAHPRHGPRRAGRRARRARPSPRIRSSASRSPPRCPTCRRRSSPRGRPGPTRRRTTRRPGSSPTMFRENFEQFRSEAPEGAAAAGPLV